MGKRVFITGATGFIGAALVRALRARGDQVVALSRDAKRAGAALGEGVEVVEGDPTAAGGWQKQVAGADAVINLAGESLGARRWNAQFRQKLIDSRIEATRYLVEAIAAAGDRAPKVLVSASGIDYYPFSSDVGDDDTDDVMTEQSPAGDTFLAKLCREWEQEALTAEKHGVRVVALRMGLVLGRGGALSRIEKPFHLFVGGRIGSGRQWVSWIHLDDTVAATLLALDRDDVRGAVNVLSPRSVRQADLAHAIGKALHRPSFIPMPGFGLKLAVGQFAEYILEGRRAAPAALEKAGFVFRYPDLGAALKEIHPH